MKKATEHKEGDLSPFEDALIAWKKAGKTNEDILGLLKIQYDFSVPLRTLATWFYRHGLAMRLRESILSFLRNQPAMEEEIVSFFQKAPAYKSHFRTGNRTKEELAWLLEHGYISYSTKEGKFFPVEKELTKIPEFGQTTHTLSNEVIKFAVVADTHLVSTSECLEDLQDFYRRAGDWGAEVVLHAGDLLDGYRVYPGHQRESKIPLDVGQHLDYLLENYPKFPKTIAILGNHDQSYANNAAFDILPRLHGIPWLTVLGYYYGRVDLGGLIIDLQHGDGGGAYAVSYKLQKYLESYSSGNKPALFFLGHYHSAGWVSFRNIEAFHAGCFQKDNLYTRRKKLVPAIGGYFVKVMARERGERGTGDHEVLGVTSLRYHWLPYYK